MFKAEFDHPAQGAQPDVEIMVTEADRSFATLFALPALRIAADLKNRGQYDAALDDGASDAQVMERAVETLAPKLTPRDGGQFDPARLSAAVGDIFDAQKARQDTADERAMQPLGVAMSSGAAAKIETLSQRTGLDAGSVASLALRVALEEARRPVRPAEPSWADIYARHPRSFAL